MQNKISLIITILFLSLSADDIDIGMSLLSQGKYDEAYGYIDRAYKKSPSSSKAQLAYAKTVSSGMEAGKLYNDIIGNKNAPDSLRSEAYVQLGCLYYCKEDYDSARSMFHQADKLSSGTGNDHLMALAAFNRGDNRTPETVWLAMASDEKKKIRGRALYYLGNTFYRQGKYEQAYNCYKNASEMEGEAWTVPAYAGACLSSYYTGDTLFSTILYDKIQKRYPSLLEAEPLRRIFSSGSRFVETDINSRENVAASENKAPEEDNTVSKVSEKAAYTLQVGAFSSEENAKSLFRKMEKDFKHVSIKKERIKGTVFHKVRVELFADKEEALAYGEKHLKGRGINFRVVEK